MLAIARSTPIAAAAMETKEETVADAGGERKIKKKTMGRQKIEIKPIKCRGARYVCFSKRRKGLFKKATELCVLTGAQVAIITFSPTPGGKPYPFGHPSIDAALDRYFDPESYSHVAPAVEAAVATTQVAVLREYRGEEDRLQKALEEEAQRRSALDAAARAAGAWATSDDKVRRAGMAELVAMLAALERVQDEVAAVKRAYDEEAIMMQQWAATGVIGAFQFQYSGAGAFAAHGGAGISSHQDMDLQMQMMSGNVGHAVPPHDLPPQPPFNYGSDHIGGYGYGYGYDLGDGSGHGAAAMGGYYGATTTCNSSGSILFV